MFDMHGEYFFFDVEKFFKDYELNKSRLETLTMRMGTLNDRKISYEIDSLGEYFKLYELITNALTEEEMTVARQMFEADSRERYPAVANLQIEICCGKKQIYKIVNSVKSKAEEIAREYIGV